MYLKEIVKKKKKGSNAEMQKYSCGTYLIGNTLYDLKVQEKGQNLEH